MDLTSATHAPLWRRIAEAIEEEVRAGPLPPGSRLEPEATLARRFGVNRHTVRQAVQHLARAGLVRVEHGRGTFVEGRAIAYPLGARTRFSEILERQGLEARHELIESEMARATPEEARHLRLRLGARVARVTMRGFAGDMAMTVAHQTFPAARLPRVLAELERSPSVTEALAAHGHARYRRAWTRITAELPDAALARLLGQPQIRPVLRTEALDVAADGTPLRYGLTSFAGDLCQLVVGGDAPAR
jgi:GntR family phosphonate transport system transcriptional regulator